MAFWPLKPTKCFICERKSRASEKNLNFKQLKVALRPLKLTKSLFFKEISKCFICERKSHDSEKNLNFKQLKVALWPLKLTKSVNFIF